MIPTLYEITRGGIAQAVLSTGTLYPSPDWVATELIDGALVRVTVRSGQCMRLEVKRPPTRSERVEQGIKGFWFRDASDRADRSTADFWLWDAVNNTSFASVPDGEWEAMAVGPKIMGNRYRLTHHKLVVFSLLPWSAQLSDTAPLPRRFPMCPVGFDELLDWFQDRPSGLNPVVQVAGVVWWLFDEPVAKAKRKDYTGGEES